MAIEQTFTDLIEAGFDELESLQGGNDNTRLPAIDTTMDTDKNTSVRCGAEFNESLETFIDELRNGGTVEDVYLVGIEEDAIGSILGKLDRAVGQIGVANRVANNGAGPAKVSEYLHNAKDHFNAAKTELDTLIDGIEERIDVNTPASQSAYEEFKNETQNLQSVLDSFQTVLSDIINTLN